MERFRQEVLPNDAYMQVMDEFGRFDDDVYAAQLDEVYQAESRKIAETDRMAAWFFGSDIMKGLDGLKDTLVSHGVSVDNVTVKLNDTQESEYNTDWTEQEGSRGGNKEQNPQREQRDKEQFEKMMSFIENENGKV